MAKAYIYPARSIQVVAGDETVEHTGSIRNGFHLIISERTMVDLEMKSRIMLCGGGA